MTEIAVTVNGRRFVEEVEPRLLLTDFLRHRLGLTGTHVGCEHGVCGACTVRLDGVSVRACCILAVQADGAAVETVESLAGDALLSPLQESFKRHHALQCGFCTPGILMAADDLLSRGAPSREEIVDMLSGHLCRCTGYAPIVAAIEDARDAVGRRDEGRAVNLAQSLLAACERHPRLEAFPGLTYADLLPRVARLAGGLQATPGSRVAVVLDNRLDTALLYWASQWAGAVFVPLSWRLSDEELDYCIGDAGAEIVIRDVDPLPEGPEHPGVLDREEHETSLLLYTSGTTGRPKGVPRSHAADRAGGLGQALHHGYMTADRTLGVMPLYHTMGIHSLLAMHLVGGCYVPQPRWDPGEALRLIEDERITSLYLAPTLFHDLVADERLSTADVSSVRALGYAGAAMTSTVVNRCIAAFHPEVFVNHYGSTEVYTFSIGPDQQHKPGCAGRPSVNVRLKLEPSGEICAHLSGDEAFGGYWNRPDADAKAIRDGWYHTGDTGHLDVDGDLWIDGRLDDMIISGGENIHPLEVEDVLASHPGVREAAVIGAPDDRWGQRVVAFVVGDATSEELDAWCLASTMARFKRPREYRLVPELPKSPSGKILRRELRGSGSAAPSQFP